MPFALISLFMFANFAGVEAWHHSPWVVYPVLVTAGLIAGVVNTIAGGGSFLTLPVFMYVAGLEPHVANATNRVAILLSSASATREFHKYGLVDARTVVRILVPMLVGTPCGVLIAQLLPPDVFRGAFGLLFLAMAVLTVLQRKVLLNTERQPMQSSAGEAALFFAIGLYCGFIQAGMGLLLLLGMSLFHARELVGANAIKNAIGFCIVLVGLVTFVISDWFDNEKLIRWLPGLSMAVGNVVGGIVGAKLAIRQGAKLIYALLIVVMVATGVQLLVEAIRAI